MGRRGGERSTPPIRPTTNLDRLENRYIVPAAVRAMENGDATHYGFSMGYNLGAARLDSGACLKCNRFRTLRTAW